MKRIIIACDGTGQSASRGDYSISTNVNRFCHALLNSSSSSTGIQQIVFYQSGVGTADLGGVNKLIQGALGDGLEDNVVDGYTFIMNNYIPGDELYIFGFSRGAFTARVLANLVARLGVFRKPDYTWEFKRAWKDYREGNFEKYLTDLEVRKSKDKLYPPFLPRAMEVEVKVVGCWDTVASLGVPWKPISNSGGVSGEYEHFDGSLVKGITHAFHALALDECRGPFTPTLWFLPKDSDSSSIDLQQCWFPGVHTNVGGGYADQALADLTLAWMIDLCRPFLDFSDKYIQLVVKLDHHPETIRSKDRENPKLEGFEMYQGWGRGKCYDSYKKGQTWTWKYRTPGAYIDKEGKEARTNETFHASVRERWVSSRKEGLKTGPAVWAPEALKGFKLEEVESGWLWKKKVPGGSRWWPIGTKEPEKEVIIHESALPARPKMAEDAKPSTAEKSFELLLQEFI